MIINIDNHFFNTNDIYHAVFNTVDNKVNAVVEICKNGKSKKLEFTGGPADYLKTLLEAYHFISVNKLRNLVPPPADQ